MAQRHSVVRPDRIEYSFWLIFDAAGGMRFTRGHPDVARDERAMALTATLPRSMFKTPELRASIDIPDTGAPAMQIDVEAAGEALKAALGCDVDLQVIAPKGGDVGF